MDDDPDEADTMRRHLRHTHTIYSAAPSLAELRSEHASQHPHYWHMGSCEEARCSWSGVAP
jgi:hypothetical protein